MVLWWWIYVSIQMRVVLVAVADEALADPSWLLGRYIRGRGGTCREATRGHSIGNRHLLSDHTHCGMKSRRGENTDFNQGSIGRPQHNARARSWGWTVVSLLHNASHINLACCTRRRNTVSPITKVKTF